MKLKKTTAALTAAGMLAGFVPVPPALAASHQLSGVTHDAAAGVSVIDVTFAIDWNIDAPTVASRDRTYVSDFIREYAKSLYMMTNGKQRVGVARVYDKSRYLDNVDALLLNKDGRANGSISGWGARGGKATQFVTSQNQPETVVQLGKTLAHEWGHYAFGLFDEYREEGKKNDDPTDPQDGDTPSNTMMANHEAFAGLSTPADYVDTAKRATAQYRSYGKSAWEVMVADPSTDSPVTGQRGYPKRTSWDSFRGLPASAMGTLSSPAGYDTALKIVFMTDDSNRQVIVIDRTLPEELFAGAKRSAEQFLRKTENKARVAVMAYPEQINPPVSGSVSIDDASRTALIASINALTRSTSTANPSEAMNAAIALLQAGRVDTDTPSIVLLTSNATEVDSTVSAAAKTARIAVQPVAVDTPTAAANQYKRGEAQGVNLRKAAAGKVLLRTLAETTGGVYRHANNATEMVTSATKSAIGTQGVQEAIIASGEIDGLAVGASKDFAFLLGGASVDGPVRLSVWTSPADFSKLQWSLVAPDGKVISSALATGITATENATEGARVVSIAPGYAGRAGNWKLRVTATAALASALEYDVVTDSVVTADAAVIGGTSADNRPLVLTLELKGPIAVAGARVLVDIYSDSGTLLYAGIPARDDGGKPDNKADDGQYALEIGDGLPQGEYSAVFRMDDGYGTARLTTSGTLVKGVNAAAIPLGNFNRTTELFFVKESAGTLPAAQKVLMTEWRYAPLDYYFVTSRDAENTLLAGVSGWAKTGQSFNTLSSNAFGTGGITRYYFDKVAKAQTRGSHFYTVIDSEKKALAALNPTNAQVAAKPYNEGIDSYVLFPLVEGLGGSCVTGQTPVYRAFRTVTDDANHRYTTDLSIYNGLVAQGWLGEGVKFCAPK